nr:GNAT family N-acetyltransferase [Microlunatus panaciterrae]
MFLLDSNIAIKSDPLSSELEAGAHVAMQFHQLATRHHHDLRVHPSSITDFNRIDDSKKRQARLQVFDRYPMLENPPKVSAQQLAALGATKPWSNDAVDHDLLAAVVGDAADYLVTEDQGLHRHARKLGMADSVIHLVEALELLRALHAPLPSPPPAVRRVKVHELTCSDPLFDTLKADYPGFENWFRKASRGQRDALVVDGAHGLAAVCLLKQEPTGEFGLPGPQLKLATFKVGSEYSGQKYGELLLKTVFEQAHLEHARGIYLTVFSRHVQLIALLEDFGFNALDLKTEAGELVYAKPLFPTSQLSSLTPLEHHVRYGPPALMWEPVRTHVVPIEPRWHRALFPDAEPPDEDALLPASAGLSSRPFGNALRKAYLCNSPSRLLQPGDPLLFYRSRDAKAVFVIGICESTFVSHDAGELAARVGRRTVYTVNEIEELVKRGPVLVIMFRQDRVLRDDPITLQDLTEQRLLRSWPQSITQVGTEGMAWLKATVAE